MIGPEDMSMPPLDRHTHALAWTDSCDLQRALCMPIVDEREAGRQSSRVMGSAL